MSNSSTSYYESLLSDFENQSNSFANAQSGTLIQHQDAGGVAVGGRTQSGAAEAPLGASATSGGGVDFFASFGGQQSTAVPERVDAPVNISSASVDSQGRQGRRGLASRARDLLDERRRYRSTRSASSATRVIPWFLFSQGSVARFLRTVLIVAVLAVVLWNARFAIGDALVGLVSTLGPIALVVYCIFRIIR